MSIEKTIRSQARYSLKENWIPAISGFFLLATVFFLLVTFVVCAGDIFNIWTEDGLLKKNCENTLMIIVCLAVLLGVFLSPFKNGFYKLCYDIADNKKADFASMFYFFKGNKCLTTLQFNLLIAVRIILYLIIGLIPYYLLSIATYLFSIQLMPTVEANETVSVLKTIFIILAVVFAVTESVKLFLAEFLFIENDGDSSEVFRCAKAISKVHGKSLRKQFLSFVFWIALCFFVFPLIYVLPYFSTTYANSSKWLIRLYKEGKIQ